LFVCTKCELAINRYLDPVDIEDLLRSVIFNLTFFFFFELNDFHFYFI